MRAGVISNRASRRNRREGLVLPDAARLHPDVRHVVLDGVAEVPKVLAEFAAAGVDLVVIDGGDGTVQQVLTTVLGGGHEGWAPRFAVLPSGTTNMTARDVGLRGDRAGALGRLLAGGALVEARRHTLAVSIAGGPTTHGFFLGAGALPWATVVTRHHVETRGLAGDASALAGIVIALLRTLLGSAAVPPASGVPARVVVDGGPARDGRRFLVLATTLQRLSLGLDPFWGDGPGALKLLDIDAPPRRLALALPALVRGEPWPWMPAAGYRSGRAATIDLAVAGPVLLDGEALDIADGAPIGLKQGPEVVFVRP